MSEVFGEAEEIVEPIFAVSGFPMNLEMDVDVCRSARLRYCYYSMHGSFEVGDPVVKCFVELLCSESC